MSVRQSSSVIIVGGVHVPGVGSESAAIVTNVFPPLSSDVGIVARVNLTVFPDQAAPTLRQSIPYYDSLKQANEAAAKVPFCYSPE